VNVVTPIFKEFRGDKYKIISLNAKKARGMMTRYIIQNEIETIQDSNDKFILYYYPGISSDEFGEITDENEFNLIVQTYEQA
ncbi:peroxide stress protein YaaA, partial [Clostridium perfringens]|uniref:peroxide stress protein YaaA n=1 Tax=Clostridium perfringens TaxID=1502 RepID=UPI002ACE257C